MLVEAGLEPWQRNHLSYFAIRVGARRLADAAACLAAVGESAGAEIADRQARLVGALQHPVVTAPTYEQLRASLLESAQG
ncbi:hypothetical protein OU415_23605 [Saccharopolyspora sp. WRP15-2]|uniref:Uncharacterized protein n=2 Tax=Saccharopolyspora TaxID=1835 RepID=A0ABT4V3B0_9PSEU|nr:hypothetical protein [Saccharopolyspora oryzae]MDA3628438.1 hypothetical protein [Saccharopolyspora oryzae]